MEVIRRAHEAGHFGIKKTEELINKEHNKLKLKKKQL